MNHTDLHEKIKIVKGDIKEASAIFGGATFDIVTCNPPYMNTADLINKKN